MEQEKERLRRKFEKSGRMQVVVALLLVLFMVDSKNHGTEFFYTGVYLLLGLYSLCMILRGLQNLHTASRVGVSTYETIDKCSNLRSFTFDGNLGRILCDDDGKQRISAARLSELIDADSEGRVQIGVDKHGDIHK